MMLGLPRERFRTIFNLALPIIGGMMSQTVLNLVDTAMVGAVSTEAVAAVGIGGFANFLSQAFVLGLGTGVQAMAARRKGEGRTDEMAVPLNGGLLLVLAMSVPLSSLMFVLTPSLFPLLNPNPEVQALGSDYLQARLVGMFAVGMNFCFRGYWNGVSMSRLYLHTLLIMHTSNVAISYVLIFGVGPIPALGALGAGIGTTVSTIIGTGTYVALAMQHARPAGFLRTVPGRDTLGTILRISVPNGLQQVLFAGGFTTLFWIIGQMGDVEGAAQNTAAANVLIQIVLLAILPGLGLGLASNSLVGQALGRGDPSDAKQWGWDVVRVGVLLMGSLGIPMLLFPRLILGVFLPEAATVELAVWPLRVVGASIGADAVGMVLLQSLLGAGAARTVLFISSGLQWLLFLPAAYVVGPMLGWGLLGIWLAQVVHRVVQAAVLAAVWRQGKWAGIKV